eukprot:1160581-Pelagomonas_calceolata.AAC.3
MRQGRQRRPTLCSCSAACSSAFVLVVNTCNPRGSGPAISPAALGCMPVGELISVQEGFISVQGRLTRCRGGSSWLREGSSWCRGGSSWLRGGSSRRDVSKRL